ncbi:MAG: tryptophan 7-halogenase [Gemmatimonadota bacterium]
MGNSPFDRFEIIVLGGGPAGSAAARLLAMWGHDVAVLPGAGAHRKNLAESLPPSCRKPLNVLGLNTAVESAGFLQTHGNSAAWAGGALVSSPFTSGTGFQVQRSRFDALMMRSAAAAGASVHEDAVADSVTRVADGGFEVRWHGRGRARTSRANMVLDCTGRAGILARKYRCPANGPSTLAVVAAWRMTDHRPLEDPTHTLVESYAAGWAWSVPVDSRTRHVAVMIDPAVTPMRRRSLLATYLAEIARTRFTASLLDGARRLGRPYGCAATPYESSAYGGDGFLLVGDAASFIDPLSSFGVKKSLASGWLAAVVAHTTLDDPTMAGPALDLFEERERLAYESYTARSSDFHGQAARHHDTAFWQRRASASRGSDAPLVPAGENANEGLDYGVSWPAGDPRLASAFEFIRQAPQLRLRLGPAVERVKKPTVAGRRVVFEEHLTSRAAPGAVRYLGAIELPRLLELAPRYSQIPELYEAYSRGSSPAPLPDFLRALSALLAFGMLEPSAST